MLAKTLKVAEDPNAPKLIPLGSEESRPCVFEAPSRALEPKQQTSMGSRVLETSCGPFSVAYDLHDLIVEVG